MVFSGVMDMATRSGNHENEDFSDFWKTKVESYYFPMKQNNSAELLAFESLKFSVTMGPQIGRPHIRFFYRALYRAPLDPREPLQIHPPSLSGIPE